VNRGRARRSRASRPIAIALPSRDDPSPSATRPSPARVRAGFALIALVAITALTAACDAARRVREGFGPTEAPAATADAPSPATIAVATVEPWTPTETSPPATPTPRRDLRTYPSFDAEAVTVTLETVTEDVDEPVLVTHAADGSGRLFVVEKAGLIRVLRDGLVAQHAFLDLRDSVRDGGSEQGLLGLAFPPGFPGDDRVFVNYTDNGGDTVVSAFRLAADGDGAEGASEQVILTQPQPAANHNGGHLAFGPDGYLYIGLGDGGGDNRRNAQRPETWLGKLLRIDVGRMPGQAGGTMRGPPFGIPSDNPFRADADFLPEIWAYGFRNPWRYSFDRLTGDLFVADVGASRWEEVNRQGATGAGGENYGWPMFEGRHCFGGEPDCDAAGITVTPIAEYEHDDGNCSITGGYVYRGTAAPALWGVYLFGDYCSGRIWGAWRDASGRWRIDELLDSDLSISSFGEDEAGEVYVADLDGGVYRVGVERR